MTNTLHGKVAAVRMLESGAVQVKVATQKGILGFRIKQEDEKESTPINLEEIKLKLLKVSPESPSMVKATEAYSALIGSESNRIVSSADYGNFLVGPTTFTSHPESVRFGGVFRLNGLMTSTMPSTIITPISTLVLDVPALSTVKTVKKILGDFQSMMTGLL